MKKYLILIVTVLVTLSLSAQPEVTVSATGDMGVGTDAPENKVHVKSTSNIAVQVEAKTPAAAAMINLNASKISGGQSWLISSSGSGASLGGKKFSIYNNSTDQNLRKHAFVIREDNKVGIGMDNPERTLDVNGVIRANSYQAPANQSWPDYVFANDYQLLSIDELDQYITKNTHLPGIPDAEEVAENGFDLKEMNIRLLEKVEELTLYLIDQNKQNQAQQKEIETLKEKITKMENK